jgi:hypothetical protein
MYAGYIIILIVIIYDFEYHIKHFPLDISALFRRNTHATDSQYPRYQVPVSATAPMSLFQPVHRTSLYPERNHTGT